MHVEPISEDSEMDELMLQAALVNKRVCILLDKANLRDKVGV